MVLNSSRTRVHTAAVFVALSLTVPAAAQTGEAGSKARVDVSKIRIDNFGRINGNYYRGAQPKGRDFADLVRIGVKTLIDLTSDDAMADEKTLAGNVGLQYFQIPMTTHRAPTSEEIAQFLKIANDGANQPVYVHCVGGRHRTGVMTAVYRMTQDGWTADRAFNEMKQYKFGADFLHAEFKQFVYGFWADLTARADADRALLGLAKTGS